MDLIYILKILCYFLLINETFGYFEYCDYQLELNATVPKMFINSPNYPNKYPSGSSCRFIVVAPTNYRIKFNCRLNIDTNNDSTCSTENFYFNSRGSKVIPGSEYFCGSGSFGRHSSNNIATLSYISSSSDKGGWVTCLAEIEEINCNCGSSNPNYDDNSNDNGLSSRIVGGTQAKNNEFPSMVGIYHLSYQRIFCGATIIHSKYLLSAAHCYSNNETRNPNELNAIVGENDITRNDDSPFTKLYDIEEIIYHENYDPIQVTNDIAIIKTYENIEFNLGVSPACLPFKFAINDFVGSKVITAGWGTTTFTGIASNVLLKARLDVISMMQCEIHIRNLNFGQFCTFTLGRDACQFDSGGGLYYIENGIHYVIGIVSFGFSCASTFPSVNTRITSYLSWIQNKLVDVNFCKK